MHIPVKTNEKTLCFRVPQSSSLPQSREELWGRDWNLKLERCSEYGGHCLACRLLNIQRTNSGLISSRKQSRAVKMPIDPYHSMSKQKILPVEPLIQCEAGRAKTMQRQSLYSPRTPKWPPRDKGEYSIYNEEKRLKP